MIAERSCALEANGAGLMTRRYVAVRLILLCMLVLGTGPTYVFGPIFRETLFQTPYCRPLPERKFAPSFFLRSPTPDIDLGGSCAKGPLKHLIMLSVLASVFEHALSGLILMYRHKLPIKCLTALATLLRAIMIGLMALANATSANNALQIPSELSLFLIALGGEPVFVCMLYSAGALVNVHHSNEHLATIPENNTCSRGESESSGSRGVTGYVMPSTRPLQTTSVLIYARWIFAGILVTTKLNEGASLTRLSLICGLIWPISLLLSKIGWSKQPYALGRRKVFHDWAGADRRNLDRCPVIATPQPAQSARIIFSYRGLSICTSAIASTTLATAAITLMRRGVDMRYTLALAFVLLYPFGIWLLVRRRILMSAILPTVLLCMRQLPYFNKRVGNGPGEITSSTFLVRNDVLLIITAAAGIASVSIQHCYFITKSLIKDRQMCVNYTPFYGFVLLLSGIAAANTYYFIAYKATDYLYALMALLSALPLITRTCAKILRLR